MDESRATIESLTQRVQALEDTVQSLDERLTALDGKRNPTIVRVRPDEVKVLPGGQVRIREKAWSILKKRERGLPSPDLESIIELTVDQGPGTSTVRFIIEGRDLRGLADALDKAMGRG